MQSASLIFGTMSLNYSAAHICFVIFVRFIRKTDKNFIYMIE